MPVRSSRFVASLSLILVTGVLTSALPATHDKPIEFHWKQLPSLPNSPGVASPFAGLSHDVLLVAGGANFPDAPPWKNGTKVWHKDVFALDMNSSDAQANYQWKIVGQLPRPCTYGSSFQFEDRVICVGGSDPTTHFRDVFQLEWTPTGLKTEVLPMLPRSVANASGAISRGLRSILLAVQNRPRQRSLFLNSMHWILDPLRLSGKNFLHVPVRVEILGCRSSHARSVLSVQRCRIERRS